MTRAKMDRIALFLARLDDARAMHATGLSALALAGAIHAHAQEPAAVQSLNSRPEGPSMQPSISGDGRFVAFQRLDATSGMLDVTRGWDIFVHDRSNGTTTKIADAHDEPLIHPAISADGSVVVFLEPRRDVAPAASGFRRRAWWVVAHDLGNGETHPLASSVLCDRVYWPNWRPSVSRDGRFVAFVAHAETGQLQAYVLDRETGAKEQVSVGTGGQVSERDVDFAAISANGRYAVFTSASTLLATPSVPDPFDYDEEHRHVFLRDREKQITQYASDRALRQLGYSDYVEPFVSEDGRFVAYNHNDARKMGCPHVGFVSDLADEKAGRLLDVSGSEWFQGRVWITSMTPDARFVVVESRRHDLAPYDASHRYKQVFLFERETARWRLVSARPDGKPANGLCAAGSISADGRYVAFESEAGDLVPGDTNNLSDVFVRDIETGTTERITESAQGEPQAK
jgi:hypothetical protein